MTRTLETYYGPGRVALRAALALWVALALGAPALLARAGTSRRRPATWCNDSHFHLTNYVQQGTDIHDFLKIMGTKVGRVALFGIPLQQTWAYGNTGDFAPTYYLQTDAPLYYYSFTDAFIAMAYRSLTPAGAGALRPDDHGLQPRGHVRGRPHQAGAPDVPRRLLGDRRVHDPQGVRLRQGRGRDGQPDEPRARPDPRLRGRGRARGDPAQRRGHALPEAGPGSLPGRAAGAAAASATRRRRSSGRTAASGGSSAP